MSSSGSEFPLDRVQLTVDALPLDVVRQIRHFQVHDPDFLRRVLLYGVTHQTVFETLSSAWPPTKQLTEALTR